MSGTAPVSSQSVVDLFLFDPVFNDGFSGGSIAAIAYIRNIIQDLVFLDWFLTSILFFRKSSMVFLSISLYFENLM